MTLLYITFVILLALHVKSSFQQIQRYAKNGIKIGNLLHLHGHRLNVTTPRATLELANEMDCLTFCVKTDGCYSVNERKKANGKVLCELLESTKYQRPENLTRDESTAHWYAKNFDGRCTPKLCEIQGTSCLDLKNKGFKDGEYMIDPDGQRQGKAFVVYCDMTSFGGGWTMCYTTESHVNIKTELITRPDLGYRANCNNILFTEVIFIDEKSKQKAAFKKSGLAVTFAGNYDKKADAYGLWTAQGVASTQLEYQMLICDTTFYKGLHFSGYTNGNYKQCNLWNRDTSSPYFRTAAVSHAAYNGVAFNENGSGPKPNRLISAGIR